MAAELFVVVDALLS